MKQIPRLGLASLVLSLILATAALGGVPRTVAVENIGATWCTYCPNARCGLEMMLTEFGDGIIVMELHPSASDPFHFPEVIARANWYGVSGYPTVIFDGTDEVVGAGACGSAANAYRPIIQGHLAENSGTSPVAISGDFSIAGNQGTFQADLLLVDDVNLGSIQATLFLYEDDIYWCCGYGGNDTWNETVRFIKNIPITLSGVGDTAGVYEVVPIDGSWDTSQLHAVILVQETGGGKKVYQAGRLPASVDFSLSMSALIASAPQGNENVFFQSTLWNLSSAADDFDLEAIQGSGWPVEFQVEGDPNWYTSTSVNLAADESVVIVVRVQTDSDVRIGQVSFEATSMSSARTQNFDLRIFNGSPAVLLVDDDNGTSYGGSPYEIPYETALDNSGYLYENWDVVNGHGGSAPSAGDILGFDAVIWQTAYAAGTPVTEADKNVLVNYLNSGGNLYLNSIDLLSGQAPGDPFVTDILGVSSWSINTGALTLDGVSGHPITDGMALVMDWPVTQANKVDRLNLTASALPILLAENGYPGAARHELPNGSRVVFSTTEPLFIESNPDPDNAQVLISRILDWLLGSDTADAPEETAALSSLRLSAGPNPFGRSASIRFVLPEEAAASPVSVLITDAAGRRVRTLADGLLSAGLHETTWDGLDEGGRGTAAGIYFIRLETALGGESVKLVRIR